MGLRFLSLLKRMLAFASDSSQPFQTGLMLIFTRKKSLIHISEPYMYGSLNAATFFLTSTFGIHRMCIQSRVYAQSHTMLKDGGFFFPMGRIIPSSMIFCLSKCRRSRNERQSSILLFLISRRLYWCELIV